MEVILGRGGPWCLELGGYQSMKQSQVTQDHMAYVERKGRGEGGCWATGDRDVHNTDFSYIIECYIFDAWQMNFDAICAVG